MAKRKATKRAEPDPMTKAEVEREIDRARAEQRAPNFAGACLYRVNLNGLDLRGANLTGADMRWCVLSYTRLERAILDGADLDFARVLQGVTWTGASLEGTRIERRHLIDWKGTPEWIG